jgi:cytochrome c-type biogenesis protein CcmH/NrfF
MTETTPPKKRTGLLIWMIVSQLLALGSLAIWALMAGLSVMAFDSGVTAEAWTIVIIVWSYPIIPLILVIAAWIAYARRKNTLAAVLSGFSFAPPVLCIAFIWVSNAIWFAQNGGLDSFRP